MQFLKDLLRAVIGLPLVLVGILFAFFSIGGFISGEKWFATGFLGVGLLSAFLGFRILALRKRLQTSISYGRGTGGRSWRDDRASDRQKSFADDLGIVYPSNIRKGDLSDLIDQKLSKKTAATGRIGWAVILIGIAGWLVFKGINQPAQQPAKQPVQVTIDRSQTSTPKNNTTSKAQPNLTQSISPQKNEEAKTDLTPEPKHYQKVRNQGKFQFVWIDPQYKYDPNVYEQAIVELGGNDDFCAICFWDKRDRIPSTAAEMTDEQAEAWVAKYERNRTRGTQEGIALAKRANEALIRAGGVPEPYGPYERFFYLRNGEMVEPFGNRPLTTPIPKKTTSAPPTEPATEPKKTDAEFRTWTDSTGQHKTEAKFAGMAFGKVKIIKKDGTTIQVPIEKLSEEDQQWLEDRKKGKRQ